MNTYLSGSLRTIVHIDVASVDQLTYEEFIRSLPNPSVIGVFKMAPLKGNAILEVNPNIVFSIIDRLFGGPGLPPAKNRALTDIEDAIIRKVINKTLECFQEAWKQVVTIEPKLEVIETNPQFTQIVPPNDMVVIITLHIKIGQAEGLVNLCIPYMVVEPIMSKLTTTYWVASSVAKQGLPEHSNVIQRKVEKTLIPMIIELGQAIVTVQELLGLTVDDVLQLDSVIANDLKIIVGEKEKFRGKPGLSGRKVAIQITHVVSEGEDDNE
jgi:flagellar motor switch protein FliM